MPFPIGIGEVFFENAFSGYNVRGERSRSAEVDYEEIYHGSGSLASSKLIPWLRLRASFRRRSNVGAV